MALVLKDRVKETTNTTSTGTYTLAGAVAGYQSFSVIGDGNNTYYAVSNGTDWEVGIGTYTASGTTLSRDTILESSNSGSAVNWSAGPKDIFVTYPSEKSSTTFPSGSITSNYTASINEGVLTNTTGGPFTVTLPASPITGAIVVVADVYGTWGTNNLTIGRNGSTIAGLAENLICNISGISVQLIYDGTTWGVFAQVGANSTDVVTINGIQTLTNKTIDGLNNTITNVSLATAVTGTLPVGNGGTGQTSYTDGQLLIGNSTGNTLAKATLTAGTGISVTNGAGSITVAATNNGTVTSVGGTGTVNGITLTGTVTSSGNLTLGGTLSNVSLTTQVTGTLPIANGGTGTTATTFVNLATNVTGDLPFANLAQGSALSVLGVTGNATADVASIAAGTDHQVLRRSGTSLAFGSINLAQSAAVTGTLAVGNGGTGATTLTANNVILGNGTSAVQFVAPGASGNILTSNGTTWTSATPAATGATKPQAVMYSLIFG